MDASPALARLAAAEPTTRALLVRLWREEIRAHLPRLLLILALTSVMAGATALYPVVIDHAFTMFTAHDARILYQVPALVLVITSVKALAQYAQNVEVQRVVLRVIQGLQ
ncbi:MAG: ABC transporter permease, partial [Rhodospirillales bacterium]|nr:ABC transporter permease [Rhodospirillales bacterium]